MVPRANHAEFYGIPGDLYIEIRGGNRNPDLRYFKLSAVDQWSDEELDGLKEAADWALKRRVDSGARTRMVDSLGSRMMWVMILKDDVYELIQKCKDVIGTRVQCAL